MFTLYIYLYVIFSFVPFLANASSSWLIHIEPEMFSYFFFFLRKSDIDSNTNYRIRKKTRFPRLPVTSRSRVPRGSILQLRLRFPHREPSARQLPASVFLRLHVSPKYQTPEVFQGKEAENCDAVANTLRRLHFGESSGLPSIKCSHL